MIIPCYCFLYGFVLRMCSFGSHDEVKEPWLTSLSSITQPPQHSQSLPSTLRKVLKLSFTFSALYGKEGIEIDFCLEIYLDDCQ